MAEFRICVELSGSEAIRRFNVFRASDPSLSLTEVVRDRDPEGPKITTLTFTTDDAVFSSDNMKELNLALDAAGLNNRI